MADLGLSKLIRSGLMCLLFVIVLGLCVSGRGFCFLFATLLNTLQHLGHIRAGVCMYVCMHVCMHMLFMYIYVYIYIYTYVCMYVCMNL